MGGTDPHAFPHNDATGRLHCLTWLKLRQFAEQRFGLSTYLDQRSTKLRSKYVLRPWFWTWFSLSELAQLKSSQKVKSTTDYFHAAGWCGLTLPLPPPPAPVVDSAVFLSSLRSAAPLSVGRLVRATGRTAAARGGRWLLMAGSGRWWPEAACVCTASTRVSDELCRHSFTARLASSYVHNK